MDRTTELESRNLCRVCLTQDDDANFSDIFDTSNLPMQLLSIGSVEVFLSDGMPRKVCEICKTILGNAYKFKQICKRSDTLLKMYPMTGNVPPKITIPQEMLPAREEQAKLPEKPKTKTVAVGCETSTSDISTQTEPEVIEVDYTTEIVPPPAEFTVEENEYFEEVTPKNNNIKILNKSGSSYSAPAKQFKKPTKMKIEKYEVTKPKILNSQIVMLNDAESVVEAIEPIPGSAYQVVHETVEYLEETDEWDVQDQTKEDDVYSCDLCDRSFLLDQQLEIHRKNHVRDRPHPCDSCDKSFFTKYDLAKHVVTHTKQKDYTCVVCKKSFSRSTLLYRHEKIHTDPKIVRHACQSCSRVYLNKLDYDKHIMTHTKSRPYACDYCEKRFAFKQGLERHAIIHDNEAQPFPCQYCEYRFPSAARLQRHLSSDHAGTRPFPCSKCSKRFMLSHHLYRHMRTAHRNQEENFQCPGCEEVYINTEAFFAHCNEHANESLVCPLCECVFTNTDEADNHIAQHSKSGMFYCDYCNLIYMNQNQLDQHFNDEHANELCSVEEETEPQIEVKQKNTYASKKRKEPPAEVVEISAKRTKTLPFEQFETIEETQYEIISEDQINMSEIEGAAFVEYDVEESSFESKPTPVRNLQTALRKSQVKTVELPNKPLPMKKSPVKVEKVRMSTAKIEQLKKEGKIKIINGEMVIKSSLQSSPTHSNPPKFITPDEYRMLV